MSEPHLCPKCEQRTIYFDGICYWCRQKEKLEFYENLNKDEIKQKLKNVLAHIEDIGKYDEIYSDLVYIFYLHGICDEQIIREVTKQGEYYPFEIYKNAPTDVRDELISRLSSEENIVKLNHILSALAWQGDEVVRELFLGFMVRQSLGRRSFMPTLMDTRRLLAGALIAVAREEALFLISVLFVSQAKMQTQALNLKQQMMKNVNFVAARWWSLASKRRA